MSEERKIIINFRVTEPEYKEFERIATIPTREGKIRSDNVGTLARALCFVKINEFNQIEQMQKAAESYEKGREQQLGHPI